MNAKVKPERMREVFLETVRDFAGKGHHLQSRSVLQEVEKRLRKEGTWEREALMTLWSDQFLQGVLGWGYDADNPDPPYLHLTERGRRLLANLSRDPGNPDGYRAHLAAKAALNVISMSYITEGLTTYNSGCYKATAVMVGGAAEALVLELRDEVVSRLGIHGRPVPPTLSDWKPLTILKSMQGELDRHKTAMPRELWESYQAYWPAFTQQIRSVRNDAGHPESVDPVSAETVHAALLIFPELAQLAKELRDWVKNQMP